MSQERETVAQNIAAQLKQAGVERIYGLPGGEMLDLLEASRQVGIDFVLVHHETAAAFMASAEGRLRRSPGVCISTLGPGATNLVTGIAHAHLDRCPVIALTPDLPTTLGPDYTHQRVDLEALFRPITKGKFLLETQSARATVAHAIKLASTEPFGPVTLHVPRNIALEPAGDVALPEKVTAIDLEGDLSLEAVAERLMQAQRPLIVAGLGTPPAAAAALHKLVDGYGAPAGVTAKVKGMLDAHHPLFSGTYGGMMAESMMMEVINDCDVILGAGLDPTELDRDWPDKDRVIWMLSSANVNQNILPPNTWTGDLGVGLLQLADLLAGHKRDDSDRAKQIRQRIRRHLEAGIPDDRRGMSPLHALDTLASVWPGTNMVCCDVGAHKLLIGQQWPATTPNRFFLSNGLSSMGYGVAAPIALNLASGLPVLSVVGDGGLMMLLGEMETAVRMEVHVLYVVFCDSSFGLIESAQRRREYPLYGMRFSVPDIESIGNAFGLPAWQVEDETSILHAVESFENTTGPTLIAITVDPREYDTQAS